MKFGIFNGTQVKQEQLYMWVKEYLCSGLPDFYVIVKDAGFDGAAITNIDRPTILIGFRTEEQFKRTLKHELIHLIQHKAGYADESEAYLKNGELRQDSRKPEEEKRGN